MNSVERKTAILILSSIIPLMAVSPALVGSAHAITASSYSFNLIGPNTSLAEATIPGTPIAAGDVQRLTGSGAFDTSAGTASGGGSFTHYKADGSVFARGTWVVTGFQSFTSYGGPNPGTQGGVLVITVTLYPNSGPSHPGTLQVSCGVNAPPGAPDEGTTLPGLFGEPTGGHNLFHIST